MAVWPLSCALSMLATLMFTANTHTYDRGDPGNRLSRAAVVQAGIKAVAVGTWQRDRAGKRSI